MARVEPGLGAGEATPRKELVGRVHAWARRFLGHYLASLHNPPIRVVLWDGSTLSPDPDQPVAVVRIRNRAALLRILLDPGVNFGDAYRDGDVEVDALVPFLEQMFSHMAGSPRRSRFRLLPHNPLATSRANIHHHYDLGNAFYRLWLDERMLYTCAYFPRAEMDLEAAQLAKMDHVCRKLRLQPGERVVEAGCGWGALALHMAARYGVSVRAFNISHEQIIYARELAQRQSLSDRVEFVEDDYRNISGRYDTFLSVGMLEHVGIENYARLGALIDQCLSPTGRGLIHSIGCNRPEQFNRWVESRIFPGAEPPSLGEMMQIFEPHDFSVLDVENLRLHYAETLRHWLMRFERSADTVRQMFDERFVRTWRLYLAGSVAAFTTGSLQLFQVLFNRRPCNDIPRSRAELYQVPEQEGGRWSAATR